MKGAAVVIEDDDAIADLVGAYLAREGFDVVREEHGEAGLAAVAKHEPRIVILDLGLPDLDGFELCRRLRERSGVPILILTARDEEIDRILGLELGADDYLTKPFSPHELVARIRAVLRRTGGMPSDDGLFELGDVRVDRRTRSVSVGGRAVALRVLEFELLVALAERAGRVVTRDELLERVWGASFAGGTRTVDVHVAQVRKKLARPQLIETVRGVGYRALERPPLSED